MSLAIEGLRLALGPRALVDRLDLRVEAGRAATLMGPSGCGKSSVLAWLGGTLDAAFAATGAARLAGTDLLALPPHRRRLGILFQDDLLFPHLTLAENLAFGLPRGIPRRPAIEAALRDAELEGMGGRRPATLSGGQRARAALFRTLLSGPRALLLDEPFAALDVALRARMRDLVLRQAEARGLPVLLVTHDPADAMGHVVQLGVPPSGGPEPVA